MCIRDRAYVDQQHKSIDPEKTVYEVISQGTDLIMLGNRQVSARAYVARFNFTGADQEKKCGMAPCLYWLKRKGY